MRAPFLAFLIATSCLRAEDSAPADRNAAFERVRDAGKVGLLIERADTELSKGHAEASLAAATEAAALDPKNPDALNAKADALIALKRYGEASTVLDEAIAIDSSHFAALYNRGEALLLQGKSSDALAEFRLLFAKHPNNPQLKFMLYLSAQLSGREDLAADALRSLRFPSDGPAWYYANAADKLVANDKRAAKKLLDTARAIHPDEAPQYDEALAETGILK